MLPLGKLFPNMITIMALCAGLSAIRFAFHERWEYAVAAIIVAGILDGMDGRLARLLNATSTFGAQLDSLSDFISFGVAPAMVLYIWKLHEIKGIGWAAAMLFAVCCAIRLARFNTQAAEGDVTAPPPDQYFTGVPAPGGGGLSLLPMMLTFEFGTGMVDVAWLCIGWTVVVALLMASRVPTFSIKHMGVRHDMVGYIMVGAGLIIAFMIIEPWMTFPALGLFYVCTIPAAAVHWYRRRKRLSRFAGYVGVATREDEYV
jgi:CDP-diacylglycerol--serine O-phosphatidyltransferase